METSLAFYRTNSENANLKYYTSNNKLASFRDNPTIRISNFRYLTPSFLVEKFPQLNPIAAQIIRSDATHFQIHLDSFTHGEFNLVFEDSSDTARYKEDLQIDGLIASLTKMRDDSPEMGRQASRKKSYIGHFDPSGSTTDAVTVPGAPTNLRVPISDYLVVELRWQPPSDNGGSVITGYKIEWSSDGNSWKGLIDDTKSKNTRYIHKSDLLKPDSTFHYRVSAINSDGTGMPSDPLAVTASRGTGIPTSLASAPQLRSEDPDLIVAFVSWSHPTDLRDGDERILSYHVDRSHDNGDSWQHACSSLNNDPKSRVTPPPFCYDRGLNLPGAEGFTVGSVYGYRMRSLILSDINAIVKNTRASYYSDAVFITLRTAPGRPTLTATADGPTIINLSWTAPTNTGGAAITGYRIEVLINERGWYPIVEDTKSTTTTYSHTGLSADTTLRYLVRAINSVGRGSPSNIATATTDPATAPDPPTSLTAKASGQKIINLSWTAPTNTGGAAITGYRIEESTNGGTSFTNLVENTKSTATTYSHTGLSAGTTRHYQVRAINSVGPSVPSNTANASTDPATAPGPPTSLTAKASGQTTINLSWTAPSNTGGAAITGYRIAVSTNGGTSFTNLVEDTKSTATAYSHTGLSAGTTRHYQVRAINSVGPSVPSNTANASTDPATAPGPPTSLTAKASGQTTINLSWTAPSNTGGAAITGYRIAVSTNGGTSFTNLVEDTKSTATTYSHTGLSAGTMRHYQVRAINSVGPSVPSNTANASTDPATAPGPPTSLTAKASGQTTINLSWTAPSNTGGAAITGYRIEESTNGGASFTNLIEDTKSTSTTYSHTGLSAGTTRHYQVRAINSVGPSVPSNTANASTDPATAPGPPTSLTAKASGQTTINLSWTAPSNTGGAAITGYKIEVSTNGGTSFTNLVEDTKSTTTTYSHTGLSAGTTRHYRVSAINSAGTGSASNIASATTDVPIATVAAAPTSLRAKASGQTMINLSWTAPTNTGGAAITGYRIAVSTNGGTSFTNLVEDTKSTSTTYSHTGLSAGTTRHYRVSAINSVGDGTPSNIANATTDAVITTAPDAPTSLTAKASGQTMINLSWTAPSNTGGAAITGYQIAVSTNGGTSFTNLVEDTKSTSTTYSHTGLSAGTTRHYQVRAINPVGPSSTSNTANASTDVATAPDAPNSLTATASGQTIINLSWAAPLNTGGVAISGYRIEVSTNGGTRFTNLVEDTGSGSTIYSHTGLSAGTTRHYQVRAINSVGPSPPSNTASATTDVPTATAPDAPTSLTATASGQTIINLSWAAPLNTGGVAISGYRIEVSTNGGSRFTNLVEDTGSAGTIYSHTGLSAGTTRHYQVRAINSVGPSPPSNTANTTTNMANTPDAPTSLTAVSSGQTIINLSWNAPLNAGGNAITGYWIEASPNGTSDWSDLERNTGSTVTIYSHTGLSAAMTWYYRVRAINSVGSGTTSNVANATTDANVPSIPTGLTAVVSGSGIVTLSWTAPSDDGGAPIMGYRIYASPDGTSEWMSLVTMTGSTATTYTLTNVHLETTQYFRITAINSVGESVPSANATLDTSNPVSFQNAVEDQVFPIQKRIPDIVLPEAFAGTMPYVYVLTPSLPKGLTLNLSTRTISGTPSETMPTTSFTWEVKDAGENIAKQEFGMEVYKMSFTESIPDQSFSRTQPITALVLPEVIGGKEPVQYSFNTMSLPSGLTFDLPSRTISGIPVVVTPPVLFTFKAVDLYGAQDSVKFNIEVLSPVNSEHTTYLPTEFTVHANYPNPFFHSTNLVFDLPWPAEIKVEIFDVIGQQVAVTPPRSLTAGWKNEIRLDHMALSSGTYLYRIIATSLESGTSSVLVGHFVSVQ